MPKKKRRKFGRPATGRDPVIPVRLPPKLLRDIDAWASVYEDYAQMNRSAAIRCLVLLGLERPQYRAVDPKGKVTFEGSTLPLLKFYRRGDVSKWLLHGIPKVAKLKPPRPPKLHGRRGAPPTKAEIDAIVERAMARSQKMR